LGGLSQRDWAIFLAVAVGCAGIILTFLSRRSENRAEITVVSKDIQETVVPDRQVVFSAVGASVKVSSAGGYSGIGFFIGPKIVVTTSRIAGSEDSTLQITMPGGRQISGRVLHSDRWAGLATIEVEEGADTYLKPGDTTLVERGEAVTIVGGTGQDLLTADTGVVTRTGVVDLGRILFQIEANLGDEGSPVIDRSGRLVAILTGRRTPRSSAAFSAIPIAYLLDGTLQPRPEDSEEIGRWKRTLEFAHREDLQNVTRVQSSVGRPTLVRANHSGDGKIEVEMQIFSAVRPFPEARHFEIRQGQKILGSLDGTVAGWRTVSARKEPQLYRLSAWYEHHHIDGSFFVATVSLHSWVSPEGLNKATLVLSSGASGGNRVVIEP
jgi:hypothetical protein